MSCLTVHTAQYLRLRSKVPGTRVWEKTHWGLLLLLLAAGCLEECGDDPPEFEGVLRCATDSSAPLFTVTVNAGQCAYVPRCAGLVRQASILKAESTGLGFGVETDPNNANSLPHASKIRVPRPPFVSTNSNVHPHLYLDWKRRRAEDPEEAVICAKAGTNPPVDEPVEAWAGYNGPSIPPTPDYESFAMEFYVTITTPAEPTDAGVSEDAGVGVDASTPDTGPEPYCGDGIVTTPPEACDPAASGPPCTSECTLAPLVGIVNAFMSPKLPPGVEAHFTGVTQFVMAELTDSGAELSVSCSHSDGEDCGMTFDASVPSSETPMSEVALSPLLEEGEYNFSLRAELSGAMSDEVLLTAKLRPSAGELKCEQATDGPFGPTQERWFGLQLVTPDGSRVATADYYMYERTTPGQGWNSATGQFPGEPYLLLFGKKDYIHSGRNFLIIAVDSASGTVEAAREFRWNQEESIPTQGCRVCDKSANGDCTIIPPE